MQHSGDGCKPEGLEGSQAAYAILPLPRLRLVRTTLLQTLQEEGLERIPVLGLPYDPNFSEAVATEPVDDPALRALITALREAGTAARDH